MSADAVVLLDELRLVVVVDNESDTLSSIDAAVPQTSEVAGLAGRVPTAREFSGHAGKVVFDSLCCACHGLSVLVAAR